ncbi:MAG: hypothetical protein QXT67_04705 [Candidatus Bathyarchaeia archaeon]
MSEVQKWGNEIVALGIVLTIVGIVIGIGMLVQSQFESIEIIKGTNTTYIDIPSGLELSSYASYIQTLTIILVVSAIVSVVFTIVIPKLRQAAGTPT